VIEGKNRDTRRRANPQKYGEYEWDISDMPRFVYHDAPSSEEVQTAMVDVGLLAIWGLVLFLGACVAMLRYDLR
jgi:hypothetical protein